MSNSVPKTCPRHLNEYLELKDEEKTYNCDGCKTNGKGPRYRCNKCDYVLHSECMLPSNIVTPPFLSGSVFEFMKKPPSGQGSRCNRYCDACGMAVKGFVYHCYKNGFDLHPCCANLEAHLEIDGQTFTLIKESGHEKCDLCNYKSGKNSDKIDFGWFYASHNDDYNYKYHVCCIKIMAQSFELKNKPSSYSLALEKLELPSRVKRSGKNGDKYRRILKAVITYVIAIVFGDPTVIVAKLAVESVVKLGELLL